MAAPLKAVSDADKSPDKTPEGTSVGRWSGHPWMKAGLVLLSTLFLPYIIMGVTALAAVMLKIPEFNRLMAVGDLKTTPEIFGLLLGEGFVTALWYVAKNRYLQNDETTGRELKAATNAANWMAIIAAGLGMWMIGNYGSVYWWFIIPGIVQIYAGPASSGTSINNALQKPIMKSN